MRFHNPLFFQQEGEGGRSRFRRTPRSAQVKLPLPAVTVNNLSHPSDNGTDAASSVTPNSTSCKPSSSKDLEAGLRPPPSLHSSQFPSSAAKDSSSPAFSPEHVANLPSSPESVPPDGGYGWVCVFCVFLFTAQTWGVSGAYGVFLNHYLTNSVFPGVAPIQYAFIGSFSVGFGLFFSPLPTFTVRHLGTRISVMIGIILEFVALLCASFIDRTHIYQLYLTQGLTFAIGNSFIFVSTAGNVAGWFTKKRSLANAISSAGSGLGAVVYSLSCQALVQKVSLSWAFRFLAISTLVCNLVAVTLIRDFGAPKNQTWTRLKKFVNRIKQQKGRKHSTSPSYLEKQRFHLQEQQQRPATRRTSTAFDYTLFARPEFLLLLGVGVFYMLGYIGILFTLQSYATSLGIPSHRASIVGAVINVGQTVGRPLIGYFSDASGRLNMALVTYFLSALFVFTFWIPARAFGTLVGYGLVGGIFLGTFWATVAPVSAEIVGMAKLSAALSITLMVVGIPSIFSEAIVLQLRETSLGYLAAQLFTGFMYFGSGLCILVLRGWKLRELQMEKLREYEREVAAATEVVRKKSERRIKSGPKERESEEGDMPERPFRSGFSQDHGLCPPSPPAVSSAGSSSFCGDRDEHADEKTAASDHDLDQQENQALHQRRHHDSAAHHRESFLSPPDRTLTNPTPEQAGPSADPLGYSFSRDAAPFLHLEGGPEPNSLLPPSNFALAKIPTRSVDGENVSDQDGDTVIPPHAQVPPTVEPIWKLAFYLTRV